MKKKIFSLFFILTVVLSFGSSVFAEEIKGASESAAEEMEYYSDPEIQELIEQKNADEKN